MGVNKYLVFDSVDKNKDLLKKYNDFLNRIMSKIKEVSNHECDYEKDYKPLNFHNMTITIRYVFEEDGKLYPQAFLDDTLYELSI